MERRSFLSAGGATALALAVGSPSVTRIESDGPVAVVETYYRRASDAEDAEAFVDDVRDLAHSASPLSELAGDAPMAFDATVRQEFVEAAVVGEDLSVEEIRGISGFLAASLTDAETDSIADENALVSATVEADGGDGGETQFHWLVATDGGEWRLVWPGEPDGPTVVVEEFYDRAEDAEDAEAFADDVRDLAHSASPLAQLADDAPGAFDGTVRQEFVGAEVVDEDLSSDRIRGVSGFLAASLTDAETDSIADENALVSATVEADDGESEFRWLVATDDGEWRLVWPGGPNESDEP